MIHFLLASISTSAVLCLLTAGAIALLVFPVANAQTPNVDFKTYKASYGGQGFDVKASIPNNGTIDNIEVYPEYGSIYITLTMSSAGQQSGAADMKIILPRGLIDSKENGTDSKYVVVVDSNVTSYKETRTTSSERELSFSVPVDASDIEIFGKQVVPEFPPAVIAAIAMSVVIVVIITGGRFLTNGEKRFR